MSMRKWAYRRVWARVRGQEVPAVVARVVRGWVHVVTADRHDWVTRHRVRQEHVRPRDEIVEADDLCDVYLYLGDVR